MPTSISAHGSLKEVSPVSLPLHLCSFTRKRRYRRLQQAYGSGALRVVRRIQALLALAANQSVQEVAAILTLGQPTLRASSPRLAPQGRLESGVHTPTRATEPMNPLATPRAGHLDQSGPPSGGLYLRRLAHADDASPRPAPLRRLVSSAFSGHLAPQSGGSYQTARFVSEHLKEANRLAWCRTKGRRFYSTRASAKPGGSLAMKPDVPHGARAAPPEPPQASNPQCPPVASAKATRCLASSTIARDGFATQGMRGGLTPRAMRPCCSTCCPKRDVTSWCCKAPSRCSHSAPFCLGLRRFFEACPSIQLALTL